MGECPIELRFENFGVSTDNFCDQDYIDEFQFGKVYHGIGTTKARYRENLGNLPEHSLYPYENPSRLMDEVIFLQQQEVLHPGLMKLYGYCCEAEQWGVVYDFKSFNTVANLVLRDDFLWWQRIKVALRFAQLLRFLHVQNRGERPFLIRNISADHIMVDEDWNPKLYDFGMITGGFWSHRTDEYAFGVLLLGLITKEVYTEEDRLNFKPCVAERAFEKYSCDRELVEVRISGFRWCTKALKLIHHFVLQMLLVLLASHCIV
ncbi:UNVERIFIED_CONTAM: Receptor-like kinase LIP2 [Sesamum calycinum]|uniref:Receptor-like kinase LIP2 n=1 Tax=Sesamum calycinum TaxID=2727403 RepID=A0AAW2KV71_9LAMI